VLGILERSEEGGAEGGPKIYATMPWQNNHRLLSIENKVPRISPIIRFAVRITHWVKQNLLMHTVTCDCCVIGPYLR